MITTTKLRKIGTSTGVIIPKEILDKLNLQSGDEVSVINNKGEVKISKTDKEFEEDLALAKDLMKKRYNLYKKLSE